MRNVSGDVMRRFVTLASAASIAVFLLAGTGCSHPTGAAAPPPLEVQVAQVEQRDVPLYQEWIGTLDGLVNADIKAEVSGYLVRQA